MSPARLEQFPFPLHVTDLVICNLECYVRRSRVCGGSACACDVQIPYRTCLVFSSFVFIGFGTMAHAVAGGTDTIKILFSRRFVYETLSHIQCTVFHFWCFRKIFFWKTIERTWILCYAFFIGINFYEEIQNALVCSMFALLLRCMGWSSGIIWHFPCVACTTRTMK